MPTEIICAHRWREKAYYKQYLDKETPVEAWWMSCHTCNVTWYSDKPEPRVVMFRVEEVK